MAMTTTPIMATVISIVAVANLALAIDAHATPQFARTYRVDCSHCHSLPPRLNERGLAFMAAGYRMAEGSSDRRATVPLAVWNTVDSEWRHSTGVSKSFPGRVELISAGRIANSRVSYFAEWRALSQSLQSNGRLLNRSGRFEDLFLVAPLTASGALTVTGGQFRALSQVDVSQRLGISEPSLFSSSVPGTTPARSPRLTSLRAFSASGRQPGVRVEYQSRGAQTSGNGWFAAATLPLAGELTSPFTDASSFEFEARPKGVFLETYRRSGLTSIGGHSFFGDRRRFGTIVVTHDIAGRLALLGGMGTFHAAGVTDTRFSVGGELTLSANVVAGIRVDHRTRQRLDPVVLLYGNGHLPFGPSAFRQALRLQIEQRVQDGNHVTTLALSHIF